MQLGPTVPQLAALTKPGGDMEAQLSREYGGTSSDTSSGAVPIYIAIGDVRVLPIRSSSSLMSTSFQQPRQLYMPDDAFSGSVCTIASWQTDGRILEHASASLWSPDLQVITISGRTIKKEAQVSPNRAATAVSKIDDLLAALPQDLVSRGKEIRAARRQS